MNGRQKGFTLIEVLIVIGLISILAAIVIIAINPARQFAQARNTQRFSNVNAILNSIHQNMADNDGNWTCANGDIPTSTTYMRSSGGYDICSCLVDLYLAEMPYDPVLGSWTSCSNYDTYYTIVQSTTTAGRVTVSAPSAELGQTIRVTR